MSYRFDLTDAQWNKIAHFFPDRYHHGQAGHPFKDHRPLVNGILWHLHTGAPWPDTPARYGPWQTVYDRFNRWRKDGTWAKILDALLLDLDRAGGIERDLWCFDATNCRAHTAAAGAKKKSRPAARVGRPTGHAFHRAG
jgi:transposase